ncbi:hypothetical protein [Spirillospora sp. NPDC029432]|uniref:hypothetical protein n=1 Tax=Spirillospora sp. NPDC029432 TaxID=3154599 RepID=UPI00345152DF
MSVGSAVRRGGLVFGVVLAGFVLAAAGHLWLGPGGGAAVVVFGTLASLMALGWLYGRHAARGVPLVLGVVAVFGLNIVGVVAVRDIAMTLVGVDAQAIVERTWTRQNRGSTSHHCTLRLADGTALPGKLATSCEGYGRGDTLPVVIDPQGRFAAVGGPKSELPTVGEGQVAVAAGLVLLVSITFGSLPERDRQVRSPRRSRASRP